MSVKLSNMSSPPNSLSNSLAKMSISHHTTTPSPCRIEKHPDLQIVQFSTGGHHSNVVVPHSFVQWTNEHDVTELLQARWKEHLIEQHLLCGGARRKESHEMLLKHQMERAKLELELYHAAVDLQAKSRAGHAACSSSYEPVDIDDAEASDYEEMTD